MKLYVGWDVGGWHCDKNKASRDALVVTSLVSGEVTITGVPWRGNLRSLLVNNTGHGLVTAMLNLCSVDVAQATDVVFAIDTPLGWPSAMLQLVQGGAASLVSAADGENPYTRRATELELIRRGFAPLSAVRDMLGSQSTKGIHFLRAANLTEVSAGVWRSTSVTAIETYPAVALKSEHFAGFQREVLQRAQGASINGPALHHDIRDALACSLVAHLYAERPAEIEAIPPDVPAGEGWIVLPKG